MKDLSIAQEYLLCSLNNKGKLPLVGKEVPACVLASGLIELLVGGCIQMDEKNMVYASGSFSEGPGYLKSLSEWIRKTHPVKIEKIAREYCMSLTEKNLSALVNDIGNSLADSDCVTIEKGTAFSSRNRFIPNPDEVDKVIQKIRADLLEDGAVPDETVALVSLLEKSYQIKKYFSSYEAKQLKERLKEIREAPSNKLVRQMVEYVDKLVALIAVITLAH